jgi:hypothetical protein
MVSQYSSNPVSNMPIYSSCKSFQSVISESIGYENQEMDVLTVKNMPSKSKRHPLGVNPAETVDGVFNDLGYERISYGHYSHALFRYWIMFQQCQTLWNRNTLLGKMAGLQ